MGRRVILRWAGIEKVARHDTDLARQMRKAATSAPSNLAEGNRRGGGDRLLYPRK